MHRKAQRTIVWKRVCGRERIDDADPLRKSLLVCGPTGKPDSGGAPYIKKEKYGTANADHIRIALKKCQKIFKCRNGALFGSSAQAY
ncbi:hypothetical protein [Burkholderia pseudomultivorans]|uniref:hypothetical protein n=1 Tax=Burkholderia pseudomultivorans TaxID=1207504 RepID=UPI00188F05DC|nr:hypothetical protein [Burkholderia pseudomultivorans]MBF5009668.1 hypothetical protein [Burkholderia pseudomultivorans]